jgi:hypothetical protein
MFSWINRNLIHIHEYRRRLDKYRNFENLKETGK